MAYCSDREFTNYVHRNLAMDIIYAPLGWVNDVSDEAADVHEGIDYTLTDLSRGESVTVQERFREYKYREYGDFTIRYEREHNAHADRRLSEYYKIRADYMVYGIINSSKEDKERATGFVKYAVVDLGRVKELIDCGKIVIDRGLRWKCRLSGGVIYCPVNENRDDSSSFVPIDINMLNEICPESILVCRGF